MRGRTLLAVAVVVLLVMIAVPTAGLAVADSTDNETATNDSTENETVADDGNETADDAESERGNEMAPGQQLQAITGAQNAELDGDISQRAFGLQMAAAESDDERAEILAERVNATEERLNEVQAEQANLSEEHGMGMMPPGLYQAQASGVGAQAHGVAAMVNQTAAEAADLPEEVLEQHNVSVAHIQELQANASELTGSEVSEIARNIGGPGVGQSMAGPPAEVPGHSDNHSPPGMSDNHTPPGQSDTDRPGGSDTTDNETETVDNERPGNSDRPGNGGSENVSDDDTTDGDDAEDSDDERPGNGGPGN